MGVNARETFARLVERDDPGPSLAEAALWIAAEEHPGLDVAAYLARFDGLAARVDRLGAKLGLVPAEALRVGLAEEQGFHGNHDGYYDPANSFLNEVLDRRAGIPITLSLVYIEVARRLGWQADGIAFPGHFLMRLGGAEPLVLDPFHGGRVLTDADCAMLLQQVTGGQGTFTAEMLAPAPWRKVLYRLLANLKTIYSSPAVGDFARALAVVERMLLVQPGSLDDVRDRGLLLHKLDRQGRTAG